MQTVTCMSSQQQHNTAGQSGVGIGAGEGNGAGGSGAGYILSDPPAPERPPGGYHEKPGGSFEIPSAVAGNGPRSDERATRPLSARWELPLRLPPRAISPELRSQLVRDARALMGVAWANALSAAASKAPAAILLRYSRMMDSAVDDLVNALTVPGLSPREA